MRVREVMTRNVHTIPSDTTLQNAARVMRELDVGVLPVVENGRPVGMVTDRDLTVRGTAKGRDPAETRVRDVMTPDVVSCYDDQLVTEATQAMEDNRIRRVLVLDRDEQIVGIVTLGDVAVETGDEDLAGNTLEEISEPGRPNR